MQSITDAAKQAASEQVGSLLEAKGLKKDTVKDLLKSDVVEDKYRYVEAIIRNNGFLNSGDSDRFVDATEREKNRMDYEELCDAISTTESTSFIPRVLTTIVREAVEPVIVLTNLFRPLRIPGAASVIRFPSVGAIQAFKIAEGQEYPDQKLHAAGYVNAKIGKYGLKVRMTDEVLRYSSFDLIGLHVRAAGRALARLKEVNVANQLESQGIVSFDNSGGTSLNGSTTGRAFDFTGNDTIRLDDVFQMYADLVNSGFIPTDFIVNPIGWLIFAREPTMRAWAFQNGHALFQAVQGEVGRGQPDESPNIGPSNASGSNYTAINQSTTRSQMVRALFPANIGMIVSPFITFDKTLLTTSIHLVDREEVGIMIQDEDVTMERWDDPSKDIQFMKWRERYALAISNDGEGVMTAKSISIAKGFDWENNSMLQKTGELPVI
jgi:hypothetical protein